MPKKHYSECGKVLAHLRVEYGENLEQQARRLGFNTMYISLIQNGRRAMSPKVYESVITHYDVSDERKEILMRDMINDEDVWRFREVFGEDVDNGRINLPDMVYILTGYRESAE